jgi:hypothetical protein
MRYVLAFVLLLSPFASVAQDSQTTPPHDGTTWTKMDYFSKIYYVVGFRAGYMTGYLVAHGNTEKIERSAVFPSAGRTNDDIAKQVDLFYSDYKNKPVCMYDALFFSMQSLDGNAPTEETLQKDRASGAKGCAL